MTELSDGMRRLIEPWELEVTVNGGTRKQSFRPLVDILRALVIPSNNAQGGGGAPNTRNLVDAVSLDLLTHIQDVTRAWLQEWGVQTAGELKLDLRGYWDKLDTLRRTGEIDETTYEHLASYPDTWASRIWDLIEPPLRIPLRGSECPKCSRHKWVNDNQDTTDNLIVLWRDGQEVTAECQWSDCAAIWVGETGLIDLGRALGVEVNMEAIEEARRADR